MAVALDCGHYQDVHPRVKYPIGQRLALHAIALEKKDIIADGPILHNIQKKGSSAILTYKSVAKGLESRKVVLPRSAKSTEEDENLFIIPANKLSGFEVFGSDGIFHPADASITSSNTIKITSSKVDEIVDVRYGLAAFPLCNLYNSQALPAHPFRTDKKLCERPVR